MNKRFAQIITEATDPQTGKVDRKRLFSSLEADPSDPTAVIFDAAAFTFEAIEHFKTDVSEKFRGELIDPLADIGEDIRSDFQSQLEGQRQAGRAIGVVHDEITASTKLIRQTSEEFEAKVQAAIRELNVRELSARISTTIGCSTLKPIEEALRNLDDRSAKLEHVSATAERSIETWRKAHFGGIVAICFLAAFLLAGIVTGVVWWKLDHRYQQQLAAEVVRLSGTDDAYRQLLMLGISIHLAQWVDGAGNPVKDGTAVFIDDAEDARIDPTRDAKRATVLVKAYPLIRRIEAITREIEKQQSKESSAGK